MPNNRYDPDIQAIVNAAAERYSQGEQIQSISSIPLSSSDIALDSNTWLKIDDIICVFIDMKNSTQLSAQRHDKTTAGIYQLFTGTAVKILNNFGAAYIDVRGDGAFGLFDNNKLYHALAAGVTFKSFSKYELPRLVQIEGINITCHIGMDSKTVLVKKVGIRRIADKTDKQNEVWAGKPVNMASKLATSGDENDLWISERVFGKFYRGGSELVLKSCGCKSGKKSNLWIMQDVTNEPKYDFDKAYKLISAGWCEVHGGEYCSKILNLDH